MNKTAGYAGCRFFIPKFMVMVFTVLFSFFFSLRSIDPRVSIRVTVVDFSFLSFFFPKKIVAQSSVCCESKSFHCNFRVFQSPNVNNKPGTLLTRTVIKLNIVNRFIISFPEFLGSRFY